MKNVMIQVVVFILNSTKLRACVFTDVLDKVDKHKAYIWDKINNVCYFTKLF